MQAREELSERKLTILHAIIQTYLETGEPVGSRTISKYSDLNLSSATIRNEMADLEELGYILQPVSYTHLSSLRSSFLNQLVILYHRDNYSSKENTKICENAVDES